ncbi:MAG: hypothetical protein ACLRZ6_04590 [Lachnospiraceae bacterium]
MDITKIPQYELLEHHYVRELESEGYLMRHKRQAHVSLYSKMMIIINI